MVIVYYISDETILTPIKKGGKNHNAKLVKYVDSNLRNREKYVAVNRAGKPKSKLWGGLTASGAPKAKSLEEAKKMQASIPKDPKKVAHMNEIRARRKH